MNDAPVWAVHDGKSGMASQVVGLARAVGLPFVEKRLVIRSPWRHLPPQLWPAPLAALGTAGDRVAPPWPDLVIAVGRNTVAVARAVKRRSGATWVQVQNPRLGRREADLLVVPGHDPASGENVFRTLGAVHGVTATLLAEGAVRFAAVLGRLPRPLVTVLVGGSNKAYRATDAAIEALADQLAALAGRGFGIAVTPSRRTPPSAQRLLRERLRGLPAIVWDGSGDNPYLGMLGSADAIVATADSVSMVSEAAATGKPVHIVELDGGSRKFAAFHRAMREAGITRPFRGEIEHWRYAPPDDTARAAAAIRARLEQRQRQAG
jgi:uncharacterized protein